MSDSRSDGSPGLSLLEMFARLAGGEQGDAGDALPGQSFADFDELIASFEGRENAISRLEGPAVHLGDGLLALRHCPFVGSFVPLDAQGNLPEYAPELKHLGLPMTVSATSVGPFCNVHQALRWASSKTLTVAGKRLRVYQLGCRSKTGDVALASERIAELGFDEARLRRILKVHMCLYCVRLEACPT